MDGGAVSAYINRATTEREPMYAVILLHRDGQEIDLPFEFATPEEASAFVATGLLPILDEDLQGWMITQC